MADRVQFLDTKKEEKPKEESAKQKLNDDVFADFGNSIEISDDDLGW